MRTFGLPARLGRADRCLIRSEGLTLGPGRRVVMTGPSGQGKSTLLAVLAGLAPEPVQAWAEDEQAQPWSPPEGLRTALVLQNPWTQLSAPCVEEEIALALENEGLDARLIRARVEEALTLTGLEALRFRQPHTLSGGEAQRVCLAAALARHPDLLLLDEPLSYIDPAAAEDLVGRLEGLNERLAVLVVDHEPEWWTRWARTWWLLKEQGTLSETPKPPARPDPAPARRNSSPSPAPLLSLRNLHFAYPGGPALLRGLDLDVEPGETVVLTGPSGCGKSTLFRLLAGQVKAQSGEFRLEGRPTGRDWRGRPRAPDPRRMLWLPQNPEHFFWRERVEDEAAGAEMWLDRFGLSPLGSRAPFTLSQGEQRRLNLSVALTLNRSLLLLDEPSFGLDAPAYDLFCEALAEAQQRGQTLLVISHRPDLVRRLAHRVLSWREGRLVEEARL